MISKLDRVMCGTCLYWRGQRELLANERRVVMFEKEGKCDCPFSSKAGELRKVDLKCKMYTNWEE